MPYMHHDYLSNLLYACFLETQDDLEAITNDIKKMANNARNKLKSKSALRQNVGIIWIFIRLNNLTGNVVIYWVDMVGVCR